MTAAEGGPVANAEVARRGLEVACSGKQPGAIEEVYSRTFVDHVNSMTYRGTEGARQSVGLYLELLPDLQFVVEEQVSEGDLVASR
jgi:SnoaL-like polyketide cyclase